MDANEAYSGAVPTTYNRVEIGNVSYRWVTRTIEVDAKLNRLETVHATFDAKGSLNCYKTDIVDGVTSSSTHKITTAAKAEKWPITRANRDYAAVISSRDGAVIRHIDAEVIVEADTK